MAGASAVDLNMGSAIVRHVNLLVTQLKAAIRELLASMGVRARVLDKTNRFGETVIGVILDPRSRPEASVDEPKPR